MATLKDVLSNFDGKTILATAINMRCVEDTDDMRLTLEAKYGEVVDNKDFFLANGKRFLKPWLPRKRKGKFILRDPHFVIETISSSAVGWINPDRSFFPIEQLQVKDANTLFVVIDKAKESVIEYSLVLEN